jgi:surface protein
MTAMTRMFQNASSIINLDLTPYKYNTSNVTNMDYMFQFTYKMTNFDISNFDTSNVTTMKYFCNGAYALLEADLSALNLSKVEDVRYMFSDDSTIKKIVFPDLPMVANLNNLCSNCSALEEIIFGDIGSSYGASNKVVVRNLLAGCTSLKYIDIRGLNFYSISSANTSSMFTGVPADCEIIVADDTAKQWVLGRRSDFTNIKTVAEL